MWQKLLQGWVHGPVKSATATPRTSPGILPWSDLPESERDKDRLLVNELLAQLPAVGLEVVPLDQAP